jgi:hypothetical protein
MDSPVVFLSSRLGNLAAALRLGSGMPKYFFHFSDGQRQFTDDAGQDLSGIAAARDYATDHVREIKTAMSDTQIHDFSDWSMTVVDDLGRTVFEIGFDLRPPRPKPQAKSQSKSPPKR